MRNKYAERRKLTPFENYPRKRYLDTKIWTWFIEIEYIDIKIWTGFK